MENKHTTVKWTIIGILVLSFFVFIYFLYSSIIEDFREEEPTPEVVNNSFQIPTTDYQSEIQSSQEQIEETELNIDTIDAEIDAMERALNIENGR
jgi:peptidoglycan hydrolase CwlO-like protein